MSSADELLREAVAHLEQSLRREQEQRREAEGLLAGLQSVATAHDLRDAEAALLPALAPVFGYEAGALLVPDVEGWRAAAVTAPAFADLRLAPGALLQRVAGGDVVAVFDLARVPDLAPLAHLPDARAALLIPLRTGSRCALLLGLHPRAAAFPPRLVALARGFLRTAVPVLESLAAREREHLGALAAARAAALEQSNADLQARLAEIEQQRAQILRLSAPVLRIWHDVLAIPIAGALDEQQIVHVCHKLLEALCDTRARVAILDITGLETLDPAAAERLHNLFHAVRLLGARCFVSGVRPAVADALVTSGAELRADTFATVADALLAAHRAANQ